MLYILDSNLYLYGLQIFPSIYRLPFPFVDYFLRASQVAPVIKILSANGGVVKRGEFSPWFGKTPWRSWQPTPVSLPGEYHGQRSMVRYSPPAGKESNTTEAT